MILNLNKKLSQIIKNTIKNRKLKGNKAKIEKIMPLVKILKVLINLKHLNKKV